jgi:tetratricopeptide (TPR) repeat protein
MPRGGKATPWSVPPERPDREETLAALRRDAERHRRLGERLSPGERERLWITNPFTMAPVFYFTGISVTFFAERYLYIPSFAAAIALALAMDRLSQWPKVILAGVVVLLFAAATFQRNKDWKDNVSLYNATLGVYPEAVVFRINLGQIYIEKNQDEQARPHFEQALAHLQNTIYFHPPKEDARAYVNLATIAGRAREFDQARQYLEKALQIDADNAPAHAYLGDMIMASKGDYDAALPHLKKAIELNPSNDVAQDYMGVALFNLARYEEAAEYFQTALSINPANKDAREHFKAYTSLGLNAAQSGRLDEAKRYLEMGLSADPNDGRAHAYLAGVLLESEKNYEAAIAHLTKAIELEPSNDTAYDYMGSALFNLGRYQEALAYFQRSLEINPANQEARQHLILAKAKLTVP